MVTLEVVSLYGTNTTRDPSLFLSPEFRLCNLCPCSFSAARFCHDRWPKVPPHIIEIVRSRVAISFAVFEAPCIRLRTRFAYFWYSAPMGSEYRKVDCEAIFPGFWRILGLCDMEYARATWTSFPRSRVKDWAEGVAFQGMSMADQVAGHSAKLRFISH